MKKRTLGAALAGVAMLTVSLFGGVAAVAEDIPTPDPTVEASTDPIVDPSEDLFTVESDDSTEAPALLAKDAGYRLVLWVQDDASSLWSQHTDPTGAWSITQPDGPDVHGLDALANQLAVEAGETLCFQSDVYRDDEATASLIAGGYLDGPGNPYESWPGDGYQSSYSNVWCVTPPPIVPVACEVNDTLSVATNLNPQGWGDIKNGVWVDGGIQLTATAVEEAYAYRDFDPGFALTTAGDLTTAYSGLTGSFGVILQTSEGQNVHYDADGRYWLVTPGVLPESSPGFYSSYDLNDLISDPTIIEVAVWVNPGGSLLLEAQSYNCHTQPFDFENAPLPDDYDTYGEWTDGEYSCPAVVGDPLPTTVEQTRTVTHHHFVNDENGAVVEETSESESEVQSRDLTEEEVAALNCPIHTNPPTIPLAYTGTDVGGPFIAAGVLLLLGALTIGISMRRRANQQ